MDKCIFCHSPAVLQCQRCREYYCSAECQTADWQSHKFICVSMPQLIKKTKQPSKNVTAGGSNSLISETLKQPIRQYPDITLKPMRLPNTEADDLLRSSTILTNSINQLKEASKINHDQTVKTEDKQLNSTQMKYRVKENDTCDVLFDVSETVLTEEIKNMSLEEKSALSNENGKIVGDQIKINKSSQSIKTWKTLRKYEEDFFDAVVQYVDTKNKLLWVADKSWIEDSFKFLSEINRQILSLNNASNEDFNYGSLVIVPFEDVYYRAEIIEEINPLNEIRVRLLDYGNDFLISCDKCKKASVIIKSTPRMAFAIKCPKDLEIGEMICIRILEKEPNDIIYYVEEMNVQDDVEKSESFGHFDITKKSILSTLKDSFNMKIFHRFDINKGKAFCIINQNDDDIKLLAELNNILNSDTKCYYDIIEKPISENAYVAAQFDSKKWRRGLIVASYKNNYLVLFIDEGKIKIVSEIKRLPKDFQTIPSSTVCIEFDIIKSKKDYLVYVQDLTTLTCKSTEHISKDKKLICNVFHGNIELGRATLTHFDGNYNNYLDSDTYTYPFISGDIVHITRVLSYSELNLGLYKLTKLYINAFNEIGKLPTIQLEKQLDIGKVVLAKNEEHFFRAIILTVIDSSNYEIMLLESGIILKLNSNRLYQANDFVKFCPIINRKVSLFILNMLKTQHKENKGTETLKELCNQKINFTFEWEKDCVELFFDTDRKVSLNKRICSEIYESVDPENDFDTKLSSPAIQISGNESCKTSLTPVKEFFFKLSDVEVIPLKTGDNISLLVLDTSEIRNGIFTAASIDNLEFCEKIMGTEHPKIIKHCTRDDIEQEYSPKVGEVCLAYFDIDNLWYRAFCVGIESNDQYKLMFLDYGNIQISKSKEIRKMIKEFMFPCYANSCIISDFLNPSNDILQKIQKIIHPNALAAVDKVEKLEDQEYLITIKEIENC